MSYSISLKGDIEIPIIIMKSRLSKIIRKLLVVVYVLYIYRVVAFAVYLGVIGVMEVPLMREDTEWMRVEVYSFLCVLVSLFVSMDLEIVAIFAVELLGLHLDSPRLAIILGQVSFFVLWCLNTETYVAKVPELIINADYRRDKCRGDLKRAIWGKMTLEQLLALQDSTQ